MKTKIITILFASSILLTMNACKNEKHETKPVATSDNPFFQPSSLPLQAPPFDKIKDEHFMPAFDKGIKEHSAEVKAIAENAEPPTFENTLVPLEKSGELLGRVANVFYCLTGTNSNPTLQKIQEDIAPKLAAQSDEIWLNPKLFQRVKKLYESRTTLGLDSEASFLLEYYYQQFELNGANLSATASEQLKKLNEEEATLSARFSNQLLNAGTEGAVLITNKDELSGLPDTELQAAAENAKENKQEGKWLLALQNTTQQPLLQYLDRHETRKKLLTASLTRAEKSDSTDTRATIKRMSAIRAEKASLLGFKNYAHWKLSDQMAKTPEAVDKFLGKLIPAATAKAKKEAADIQALIDLQKEQFKMGPEDWNYYAEKVRKSRYDLDANEVKPYFELNKVLIDGVFFAANKLYGLTFKERKDLPVYHPDVRVFDVFDKDGSQLAIYYFDYFKRDSKQGGAWMSNLVGQSKLMGTKPVIYNACNFAKPAAGSPALISFDDVTTMFHEFGHGLHGLFADQTYPTLSGTSTARDFVEFPSQFNEHWSLEPTVFANYAMHYQTGKPMPQVLVDKIKKASKFNQGYEMTEALAASALDLKWHTVLPGKDIEDVDQFEMDALKSTKLDLKEVPPRYRSSYFLHIWGNGYAAGYYAYSWTKMLDEDAFAWFQQHGGMTLENGQRFRDMVLSRGHTEDYDAMFKAFAGHDPDIHPMLLSTGLVEEK